MRSGSGSFTRSRMAMILALRCGGVELGVGVQHLVDLLAAGHDRVERGHRLLEDHRHARAAQFAQPRLVGRQDVLALEQDLARARLQRLGEQAHDGEGDHRLARARFAHQADDLARIDGEAHLVDGELAVGALGQRDGEVADFEDGLAARCSSERRHPDRSRRAEWRDLFDHKTSTMKKDPSTTLRSLRVADASHHTFLLILGSSVSRRPSPMMLIASTVKARKMPG